MCLFVRHAMVSDVCLLSYAAYIFCFTARNRREEIETGATDGAHSKHILSSPDSKRAAQCLPNSRIVSSATCGYINMASDFSSRHISITNSDNCTTHRNTYTDGNRRWLVRHILSNE